MNHIKDTCLVIARLDFKDSDRILTVLGETTGKQKLIAKGVRKSTSKLAGSVELLSVGELTWINKPNADISVLTGARLQAFYGHIATNYDATLEVFAWLQLIDKMTRVSQGQEFFTPLCTALKAAADEVVSVHHAGIWLYLQLLQISGYEINWDNIDTLRSSKHHYLFDFDTHSFTDSPNGVFELSVLKILRFYTTPDTLKALHADTRHITQAHRLLSEIIKRIV